MAGGMVCWIWSYALFWTTLVGCSCDENTTTPDLHLALIKHVTRWYTSRGPYSRHVRPAESHDRPVDVWYNAYMSQLLDIDVKRQIITVKMYEEMRWMDPRVCWDPEDFGGAQRLQLPSRDIFWFPDIVLFEMMSYESNPKFSSNVIIYWNGTMVYVPATVYTVPCAMDVRFFPWDSHTCILQFGSWTMAKDELVIHHFPRVLDQPNNTEWAVTHQSWQVDDVPYDAYGNWTLLIYRLTLTRREGFFTYVIVLPSVLMSFLTLVVFWLPPDFQDQLTIVLSLFLSYFVLMMIVVDSIPQSGLHLPLIGIYLFVIIGLMGTSLIACTVIYNIATRDKPVDLSPRTKKTFMAAARLLCLHERDWQIPKSSADTVDVSLDCDQEGTLGLESSNGTEQTTAVNGQFAPVDWKYVALIVQKWIFVVFLATNLAASGLFINHVF